MTYSPTHSPEEIRARQTENARRWRANNPDAARKAVRKWRSANAASHRAKQAEWRKNNPDKHRAIETRKRLKASYGMTIAQWDALFEGQGRKCAICPATEPDGRGWHVDHCHDTGKVRGILCCKCNIGLGHFRDNSELLTAAIKYLGAR